MDDRIPDPDEYASPPRRVLDYDNIQVQNEPVGRGGQAVVYEATVVNSSSPDRIAVKQPLQLSTVTNAVVEAFLTEAETWETVDTRERKKLRWEESEYVVGVVDTGDELPWIAMEYMDGGSLADRLDDCSDGLSIDEALWIGESVCRGLEVAHSYGIAHLDLKPANVLFRATEHDYWDHPKVADWGLARVLSEQTGSMYARSPRYSAPEQFEPESFGDPDTLTDVYQVGALVYAMLTGTPPYTGAQFSVISDIISTEPPDPPSAHRSDISSGLDDVLRRALEPDKRSRYDSIQSFRRALTSQRTSDPSNRETMSTTETVPESTTESSTGSSVTDETTWPMFQSDPCHTGHSATVSGPRTQVERNWVYGTDDGIRSAPVIGEETIYVGSTDGNLYALDSTDGTLRWSSEIGHVIQSSPALDDTTVYIGGDDGHVYALDIADGSRRWTFETDRKVRSSPVVLNGRVYVGSDDGNLYALDADTGAIAWTHEVRGTIRSAPAVIDETVYLGSGTGAVYAITEGSGPVVSVGESADGTWATMTGNWVESSPAVVDGSVYVGSADNSVYAMDAGTGEITWEFATGDKVWTSPAIADGRVYAGSDDERLYALDAHSGNREWAYDAGSEIRASPVLDSDRVYAGCRDGTVFALDAESGGKRWTFDIAAAVRATPAIGDGVLYVGSESGYLYALREE